MLLLIAFERLQWDGSPHSLLGQWSSPPNFRPRILNVQLFCTHLYVNYLLNMELINLLKLVLYVCVVVHKL